MKTLSQEEIPIDMTSQQFQTTRFSCVRIVFWQNWSLRVTSQTAPKDKNSDQDLFFWLSTEGNKFILTEKTWLRANKELINTSLIEWQNSATGAKVKALRVKLLCPFYHN